MLELKPLKFVLTLSLFVTVGKGSMGGMKGTAGGIKGGMKGVADIWGIMP